MPMSIDNKTMMYKIFCNPFLLLEMHYFLQSAFAYSVKKPIICSSVGGAGRRRGLPTKFSLGDVFLMPLTLFYTLFRFTTNHKIFNTKIQALE